VIANGTVTVERTVTVATLVGSLSARVVVILLLMGLMGLVDETETVVAAAEVMLIDGLEATVVGAASIVGDGEAVTVTVAGGA